MAEPDVCSPVDEDEGSQRHQIVIKCFNGRTFSEFQRAANFFFEAIFTGWIRNENITYLIPPMFRCKSEGYRMQKGMDGGIIGNIRGDDNEFDLFHTLERLNTKPQIAFHSFRLQQRLKTYNKLLFPYYRHKHNPFEIHAKEILRRADKNSRREDAECDFMVFDKEHGIFLFEVKSSTKGRYDAKCQLEVDESFTRILVDNGLSEAGFDNAWEISVNIPIWTFIVFPGVLRRDSQNADELYAEDLKNFTEWWHKNVRDVKHLHGIDRLSEVMTLLAARFVAMASASPITVNEAIANLGDTLDHQTFGKEIKKKYKFMFFTPGQDSILNHGSEKMILTGPPGSGKSIIMMFKCLALAREKQEENDCDHENKKILIVCGYKALGLKAMHRDFLFENLGASYESLVDIYTKEELDYFHEDPFYLFTCRNELTNRYCDLFIDEFQSVVDELIDITPSFRTKIADYVDMLAEAYHFVWMSTDPSQSNLGGNISVEYNEDVWHVSQLECSLRNTENIAEEVRHFNATSYDIKPGHRIKGTATEWIDVEESVESRDHRRLIDVIKHLVETEDRSLKILNSHNVPEPVTPGGLRFKDILVFWNTDSVGKMASLFATLNESNIPSHFLSDTYSRHTNKVTLACDVEQILSMEFRVAIAMFVKKGEEYAEKKFVVPVSRAMCHLIIFRNIEN